MGDTTATCQHQFANNFLTPYNITQIFGIYSTVLQELSLKL